MVIRHCISLLYRPSAVLKGLRVCKSERRGKCGAFVSFSSCQRHSCDGGAAVIQLQVRHADQFDLGFHSNNVLCSTPTARTWANQYALSGTCCCKALRLQRWRRRMRRRCAMASKYESRFRWGDAIPRCSRRCRQRQLLILTPFAAGWRTFSAEFPADSSVKESDCRRWVVIRSAARELGGHPPVQLESPCRAARHFLCGGGVVATRWRNARLASATHCVFIPENAMAARLYRYAWGWPGCGSTARVNPVWKAGVQPNRYASRFWMTPSMRCINRTTATPAYGVLLGTCHRRSVHGPLWTCRVQY